MARKWRSGIPTSFRVDWAVAVTPIAEAGDFMDVTAELSEEAPPPGVNFWQALHVDGGRVSATMRDERTRYACFGAAPDCSQRRLLTPGTPRKPGDHREDDHLQFSGGILKQGETYGAQYEDAQRGELNGFGQLRQLCQASCR
jgi:hypothetical protein